MTRTRHASTMSSNVALGFETRSRRRKREKRELDANAGEAFPGLPNHVVATHILRSEYFDLTTPQISHDSHR